MTTDSQNDEDVPHFTDEFIDAWADVFIDDYEKLKERGELPADDAPPTEEGDSPCPST
jgi:hypothetical protein